ncbi:hypothetical protein [Cystobacter fuscus]|uniref:hypothetical protein n=1 Tax=Cystobacter fuscus TaxID=43 RepID=UPI002B321F44|nr:hypothetical protein F0U63_01340 [Cystobacter fuscus]
MRARPAARLTLVPRPETPADSPADRGDSPRQHLAPPHRATRRPTAPNEGLGALLRQGVVSAGIGALKNSGEALRSFGLGLGALARGHLLLGGARLKRGMVSLLRLALDAPLSVGGRLLSGVQTRLGLETPGCPLGARQLLELRKVFGGSIDYGRVCIKTGRLGLLALPRRPFVLGYTLYVPSQEPLSSTGAVQWPLHLLVRELTRVWQYQHGGTDYTCQTLGARWFAKKADWRQALREGRGWRELDPEQQLRFLQDAYTRSSYFRVPGHRFIDDDSGVDYTAQLEAALHHIRSGQGAP